MEINAPLRCPECGALVVDRRSAHCTTCSALLPEGWVLTEEQIHQLHAIDDSARKEHAAALEQLAPDLDPNVPLLTRDDNPTALD